MSEEEKKELVRRLLIISVGSSASIHLLGGVARAYPDLLTKNKIMIIETSRKMFRDAIDNLANIYHINYAKSKGKRPEEQKLGFPTSTFKKELEENSVLLAEGGGGATPERGLAYYTQNKDTVLEKIANIISNESGEREISGIIIIGSAGKGTGTLVTPALTRDILATPDFPKPVGFLTLPFRFDDSAIKNTMKILDQLHDTPLFLLDYERAVGTYLYLTGSMPEKEIPMIKLYEMVTYALSNVLSTFVEALNYSTKCSPPLDWSDIEPIMRKGQVGTITYSVRYRREEFTKKWKDDLSTLLLLRTKARPRYTKGITIIRGVDIPFGVAKEINSFYRSFLNCEMQRFLLNMGNDFRIVSLIHGFDPTDIVPPIKAGRGIIERLFAG